MESNLKPNRILVRGNAFRLFLAVSIVVGAAVPRVGTDCKRFDLKMQLRLVLLYVSIVSYGTQAILAETARTRMEGAIRRLARWRAAGWKNLPLSGSLRN